MNELKIEYIAPEKLTPYENNARKHAPTDIEAIKKSIEQDGFNDPIGVWGDKNIIVEGHGRQIAAMEMGLTKVPCIRLDHLTDTQRREYAIRHNRTAELSAWDFDTLQEELAALDINGIDMSDLQFDLNQGEIFDYMSDSLVGGESEGKETFSLTFEVDIAEKENVDAYIKKNGKKELVTAILEIINSDNEAE